MMRPVPVMALAVVAIAVPAFAPSPAAAFFGGGGKCTPTWKTVSEASRVITRVNARIATLERTIHDALVRQIGMTETKTLDDDFVGALEAPEKAKVVWDDEVPGFGVRVLPSGRRNWIIGYRGLRPGGKKGSRQLVIGTHGDMTVEEARLKAREALADVASEEEPDGQHEKPAAEANAGPERAAEPPPNDAAMEEAPGAGDGAGTRAVSVTPSGDTYDTETGVILSEGGKERWDPDEDLGELEAPGQGPDTSREPEAVSGGEADDAQTNTALSGVIDTVTGSGTTDRYAEVAETAERADRSGPRVETESGTGAERGRDAPGGANAAGGYPDADVDDESRTRDGGGGEERAGEAETAVARPGKAKKGFDIAKRMAGKAVKRGKEMVSGSRKGSPAGEERAEAARSEPETGPPASRESPAAEEDGSEGSGESKLDARRKGDAEAEEEIGAGNRLSEESVANLAENLDGIRGVVDRIEAWSAKMGPQMEMLSGSTAVIAVDRRRGRRRVARTALAAVALALVFFAGGAAVQSRLPFLPRADPTLGWKDHIWEHYGSAIRGCFQRAEQDESGYVDCMIKVRGR